MMLFNFASKNRLPKESLQIEEVFNASEIILALSVSNVFPVCAFLEQIQK